VLRFAVPARVAAAIATLAAYGFARVNTISTLAQDRTTAVLTLSIVTLSILALVAGPLQGWRLMLALVLAAGPVVVMSVPGAGRLLRAAPREHRQRLGRCRAGRARRRGTRPALRAMDALPAPTLATAPAEPT
jgi:hypothetical protein